MKVDVLLSKMVNENVIQKQQHKLLQEKREYFRKNLIKKKLVVFMNKILENTEYRRYRKLNKNHMEYINDKAYYLGENDEYIDEDL